MVAITLLADISGQVTEGSLNADTVTVGAVCLPAGAIKSIRSAIPRDFPKWRNATDHDLGFMVPFMLRESFSICAASIDKTTHEWQTFWENSHHVHSKTASESGGSISFLKAATLIKFFLFSQATTLAFAHSLRIGTMPKILDRKGRLHVSESVILDNEIHGHENRNALTSIWRAANDNQPLVNAIGVFREAKSLTLATEESEPLLLLPDYAAGILQAANSNADTLSKSQVSRAAATHALTRLKGSSRFHEFTLSWPPPYFDIFPEFTKYAPKNVP